MMLPQTQSPMPEHLALSIRGEEMPYHSLAWTFYGQNIIRVLDKLIRTDITLIRTSKPAYKPGQKGNKVVVVKMLPYFQNQPITHESSACSFTGLIFWSYFCRKVGKSGPRV